jgi:hypothetical protein
MARGDAVELTELLELVERKIKAGQMEPRIKEHASVTGGEDEAVAVDPAGVGRIDLESLTKEDGPDVGGSERETKMARLAGGDGVNGQTAGIAGG